MTAFRKYAGYYDALYRDKDYAGEAAFVRSRIRRHAPGARSLLDLGCGTARHAQEFVRRGWNVVGVDRSREMIREAKMHLGRLPGRLQPKLRLRIGDVTTYRGREKFDAAASLFHVINYQTTDAKILGLLRSARRSLRPGGIFMFDFWYGPAVTADPPANRTKRVKRGSADFVRIATPVHHAKRHRVDVKYTLIAQVRRSGPGKRIEEVHALRYLFLPEIVRLGTAAGFRMVESGQWLTRKPLSSSNWSGYAILRAIRRR